MVLGFGDPTKGMTRIWDHFVILDVCECVILRPQIMLTISASSYSLPEVELLKLYSPFIQDGEMNSSQFPLNMLGKQSEAWLLAGNSLKSFLNSR